MSQIKAAVFDVDGTLFDYRKMEIPDSTVAAIRRLKEKDVSVIVATSRSYPELSGELLEKVGADYYIAASGHSIQDAAGRPLHSIRFSYDQVELVKQAALEYDAGLTLKYHDCSCLYTHPMQMHRIYSNIGQSCCPTVYCESMDYHKTELPIGFAIRGEGDTREKIRRALAAYPNDFRFELFGNGIVADIYSPAANKMTALAQLVARLGLEAENCIAFGDGKNDIEMISWAGTGVAMGNGCDELKAVADAVCGPTWEDGIARALEKLTVI